MGVGRRGMRGVRKEGEGVGRIGEVGNRGRNIGKRKGMREICKEGETWGEKGRKQEAERRMKDM